MQDHLKSLFEEPKIKEEKKEEEGVKIMKVKLMI